MTGLLGKNLWQYLIFFFLIKFKKYQRAISGPNNSDSVATLEKKIRETFFWICMGILKSQQKKLNSDQTRINLTKILVILTKKKSFLCLNKS